MPTDGRIIFLDVFRFWLVSLALVSHGVLNFRIEALMPQDAALIVKALTRSATPGLLILFGIMLDHVYARRFALSRRQAATAIITRALTCYLCFIALALLALATGRISPAGLIGGCLLLKPVPMANIFAIYTMLLPLGLGVLQLERRMGGWALIGLAGAIWGIDAVVMSGHAPLPFPFAYLGGFLYGIGEAWGPSIPHALFLALVGICVSRAVFRPQPTRGATALLALAVFGSLALLVWQAVTHAGPSHVLTAVTEYGLWRGHNHPSYYAFGIATTVAVLGLVWALCRVCPAVGIVQAVGRRTLTYFLIGNAVILLAPQWQGTGWGGAVLTLGCPVAAIALTLGWAAGPARSPLTRRWAGALTGCAAALIGAIAHSDRKGAA